MSGFQGSCLSGRSELLSRESTLEMLPGVKQEHLRGGILYHDGQFDDARYAIALLRTLQDLGGTAINYVEATGLIERGGRIAGIQVHDREDGAVFDLQAKAVINACGVHAEETLALNGSPRDSFLVVSQGSHFVLPRTFLPGNTALMIPKTEDGRVLFAIPWLGALLVGTTDVPVETKPPEPRALPEEKQFLRDHIARYLGRAPRPEEILSVWSGLRPLVRKSGVKTSKLSRDHTIMVSASGLITVTGGKWTTYRRMGQDTIDRAAQVASLPKRSSPTLELKLHGWTSEASSANSTWESVYGSDLPALRALSVQNSSPQDSNLDALLHPRLPFRLREVVWAARYEMARSVEDVLARRTRALFLDARAAIDAAPVVADILATRTASLRRLEAERSAEFSGNCERLSLPGLRHPSRSSSRLHARRNQERKRVRHNFEAHWQMAQNLSICFNKELIGQSRCTPGIRSMANPSIPLSD